MSQFQYRNKNQTFISNFVFQFIKKANGTLGTRIVHLSNDREDHPNQHQSGNKLFDEKWHPLLNLKQIQ